MLVKDRGDKLWLEVTSSNGNADKNLKARNGYTYKFHMKEGKEQALTADVTFPNGLSHTYTIPFISVSFSGCAIGPGGITPVYDAGCGTFSWALSTCKDLYIPDWNEPNLLDGGHCCGKK